MWTRYLQATVAHSLVVGMDSSSDGNSPVSYASVVRGYSSPSEISGQSIKKKGTLCGCLLNSPQKNTDSHFASSASAIELCDFFHGNYYSIDQY